MLPLRRETRRARLVRLTDEGRRKMEELAASLLEESRGSQEVALLAYLDRRPGASLEILHKKFPDALQRALAQKWVTVEEVERERSRRKVFAVRLAGPLPERPPRLSPVARRIIETLERQGPAEDHRQLLEAARARPGQLAHAQPGGIDRTWRGGHARVVAREAIGGRRWRISKWRYESSPVTDTRPVQRPQ